jgi:hypothetical protein
MIQLLKKIFFLGDPKWVLIYKNGDGHVKRYKIDPPRRVNEFGNKAEGQKRVGFKTTCYRTGKRDKVRSFRYDRVISLNRL